MFTNNINHPNKINTKEDNNSQLNTNKPTTSKNKRLITRLIHESADVDQKNFNKTLYDEESNGDDEQGIETHAVYDKSQKNHIYFNDNPSSMPYDYLAEDLKTEFYLFCKQNILYGEPKNCIQKIWKTIRIATSKIEKVDFNVFIFDLCDYLLIHTFNMHKIFKGGLDASLYNKYVILLQNNKQYDLRILNSYENVAVLKSYIHDVLNGLIPSKVVKLVMASSNEQLMDKYFAFCMPVQYRKLLMKIFELVEKNMLLNDKLIFAALGPIILNSRDTTYNYDGKKGVKILHKFYEKRRDGINFDVYKYFMISRK